MHKLGTRLLKAPVTGPASQVGVFGGVSAHQLKALFHSYLRFNNYVELYELQEFKDCENLRINITNWLSSRNFFRGGGLKSIVMQISFVMLLFSEQISGRGKSFQGGANCLRGAPPAPLWKKASRKRH